MCIARVCCLRRRTTSNCQRREPHFFRVLLSQRSPCRTVGSAVLTNLLTGEQVSGVDTAEVSFAEVRLLFRAQACLMCLSTIFRCNVCSALVLAKEVNHNTKAGWGLTVLHFVHAAVFALAHIVLLLTTTEHLHFSRNRVGYSVHFRSTGVKLGSSTLPSRCAYVSFLCVLLIPPDPSEGGGATVQRRSRISVCWWLDGGA